jgi:hypothetical protein
VSGVIPIFTKDPARKLQTEVLARAYVEGGCTYPALKRALEEANIKFRNINDIMRNGYFQYFVRQVLTEKFEQLELSPQRVLQETASIAYVKVSDVYDENGDLIEPYMLPPHVAAAISGLEIEKRVEVKKMSKTNPNYEEDQVVESIVTKKYKFHDKNAALDRLARHYKIVGSNDEGINALASALADRLKAARSRIPLANTDNQAVEEANIIDAPAAPLQRSPTQESDDEDLQ